MNFWAEVGLRLLKSVCFWSLTILLGVSAYTDLAKIRDGGSAWGHECKAQIQKNATAENNLPEYDAAAVWGEAARNGEASVSEGKLQLQPQERRQIALTFDDGPHPRFTELLLDGLAQRGVPATFFVVGKNIPGNEAMIGRMQQEGHLIGNHTYDHVKISDLSGEQAYEQVEKTSTLVREITGEDTEFIRPPFGEWNKDMEGSFQMIPVLWSVDPLDWTTKNTALIEERILEKAEAGDIILMHDYYQSSVDAALDVVDALLAQGYEFVTVDKLILE